MLVKLVFEAAGGVLAAKQAPHRPGTAPAHGLRAEGAVVILPQTTTAMEGDDHVVPRTPPFPEDHQTRQAPAASRSSRGPQPARRLRHARRERRFHSRR